MEEIWVYGGRERKFEWFWAVDRTMPGLDAFEALSEAAQDLFWSCLTHWGNIAHGARPSRSRVNTEHEEPLIVAVKAGQHRFTAFRENSGPDWILCHHYFKQSERRDRAGDRAVRRTLTSRQAYLSMRRDGTYYERN